MMREEKGEKRYGGNEEGRANSNKINDKKIMGGNGEKEGEKEGKKKINYQHQGIF
jgi:hypothetical protein